MTSARRCPRTEAAEAHLALNMFYQYIYLWMYVVPAADLNGWRAHDLGRLSGGVGLRHLRGDLRRDVDWNFDHAGLRPLARCSFR